MSIELVMLSNHLILCLSLLILPSIFPNIRVFSNESACLVCSQSLLKSINMNWIRLCPHFTLNSRPETKTCSDWRLIPAHRCGDFVPTYFLGKNLVANIKISRLYVNIQTSDSIQNVANWPAFQQGWSWGKSAPSGKAYTAQIPTWPLSPSIMSPASWGHEFVRMRHLALLR